MRVDERCLSYVWSDFREGKWPGEMHCALLSSYQKEDSQEMKGKRALPIFFVGERDIKNHISYLMKTLCYSSIYSENWE